MRFQDSEPDRRSDRSDFADRGYRSLLAGDRDHLSPRQYRAAARAHGDGDDVAGDQESGGDTGGLARGNRSLSPANGETCWSKLLGGQTQFTPPCRQAERKKATLRATWGPI